MDLREFLIQAKARTYASGESAVKTTMDDGCFELTYQAEGFSYRDRYFGGNPFLGEEVVFQDGAVIWGMNYHGYLTRESASAVEVYGFLQRAMRRVEAERPFRGPRFYQEGDFEYRDESQGALEAFSGVERIFYHAEEVYRLNYHGGAVR